MRAACKSQTLSPFFKQAPQKLIKTLVLPSAIVAMIAVIAKVRLRTLIVGDEEAHVETAAISAVK